MSEAVCGDTARLHWQHTAPAFTLRLIPGRAVFNHGHGRSAEPSSPHGSVRCRHADVARLAAAVRGCCSCRARHVEGRASMCSWPWMARSWTAADGRRRAPTPTAQLKLNSSRINYISASYITPSRRTHPGRFLLPAHEPPATPSDPQTWGLWR